MRISTLVRTGCVGVLGTTALYALGCAKQQQPGDLVGRYAVNGALLVNTCGQAVSGKNPLLYTTEIRNSAGAASWQVDKLAGASGSLRDSGEFHFQSQLQTDLGTQVINTDVQPSDFLTGNQDVGIKRAHCILVTTEAISGTLHRRMIKGDGGTVVAEDEDADGGTMDLVAEDVIDITPATGADCTRMLLVSGGPYASLPCKVSYSLEGDLQK